MAKIIEDTFDNEYICVVDGEHKDFDQLIEHLDFICFTGGPIVGRHIYKIAAEHFKPILLELGGKSPCIVDQTANITNAAKRIASGKFINAGQTCIAPDYLIIHESIKEKLMDEIIKHINILGYDDEQTYTNKIINNKHLERLSALIKQDDVIYGGKIIPEKMQIYPTVMNATMDSQAMQDEIFGPILPVLTYKNEEEIYSIIEKHKNPLALYIFSQREQFIEKVLSDVSFGGSSVNDTLMHITNTYLPFGGVGSSGVGRYHGVSGFKQFSQQKSILKKGSDLFDLGIRYAKESDGKYRKFKKIFSFLR